MKSRCDLCGKGTAFGHNVSHSNRKTPRRWFANIQRAHIMVDGRLRRMRVCTRCLRTEHKRSASS